MALERKKIVGTSPRDIANINANMETLWYKMFGNLNLGDVDEEFITRLNTDYITVQGEGNLDSTHPLYVRFYIPPDIKTINKAPMNFMLSRYRMDSGISTGGGAIVDANIAISTANQTVKASAAQQTVSVAAAQQSVAVSVAQQTVTASVSSASGTASVSSTGRYSYSSGVQGWLDGNRVLRNPTRSIDRSAGYSTVGHMITQSGAAGIKVWDHQLSGVMDFVDLYGLQHYHRIEIPAHSHRVVMQPHTHSISISPHSHTVTVQPHTHSVTVQPHTHNIVIEPHNHSATAKVTIPNHTHGLVEGIKDSTVAPRGISILVNDVVVKSNLSGDGTTENDLDVSEHLKLGQWNVIKITSQNVSRITIYGIIEVVNQFATKR